MFLVSLATRAGKGEVPSVKEGAEGPPSARKIGSFRGNMTSPCQTIILVSTDAQMEHEPWNLHRAL